MSQASTPIPGPETRDEIAAYDAAALRLRSRTRWGAAMIMVATLLPYEVIDGAPQFPWHLAGELPPAGLVAYLGPALAGAVILGASLRVRSAFTLALITLGALLSVAICIHLGADASAWDILPLPDVFTRRPMAAILPLALVAAGTNLSFLSRTRKAAQGLLVGALLVALWFYTSPESGGATPLDAVAGAMEGLITLPDWRMRLGSLVMATLALWPGLIALLGIFPMSFPPKDDHPVIGLVALYGYPLLLGMFAFRTLAALSDPWVVYSGVGIVVIMVGVLVLLTSALEVAGDHGLCRPDLASAPKAPILAVLGAVALICGGQWALARPPAKGVDWDLVAASARGDQIFGERLPAWNAARSRWARAAADRSSAEAMVTVRKAARDLHEAAEALDPEVAAALKILTREARQLDLAGRRWYRLIGDLNEALRRARQPYYVDPTVRIFSNAKGLKRRFRLRAYRIKQVRRFESGGDRYAALHVTRLDDGDGGDTRLGFSRDLQPFALVAEDEIERFRGALMEGLQADPPVCGTETFIADHPAMMRCGEALAALLEGHDPATLSRMIVATTERHEIQHQIDGPLRPIPQAVMDHLRRRRSRWPRVSRELSAYLAELTAVDASPKVGLIHLVRFATSERFGVEHDVALLALQALSDRDLDGEDRAAIAEIFRQLMALDEDTLRARAAAAWGDLYGGELDPVTPLDPAHPAAL